MAGSELEPYASRRVHIGRLEQMLDTSVRVASESSLSFVFVHLAMPHAPFMWDRHTNAFRDDITDADGYFGNLALADRFLGRLRSEMVRNGT
ncbi:MAG: hypothetical protein ABIT20_07850 [Gemmatimonadaceae bacterium]